MSSVATMAREKSSSRLWSSCQAKKEDDIKALCKACACEDELAVKRTAHVKFNHPKSRNCWRCIERHAWPDYCSRSMRCDTTVGQDSLKPVPKPRACLQNLPERLATVRLAECVAAGLDNPVQLGEGAIAIGDRPLNLRCAQTTVSSETYMVRQRGTCRDVYRGVLAAS